MTHIVISCKKVTAGPLRTNAFFFIPAKNTKTVPALALFSHGYTSHKGSILNWGSRLAEAGIGTALFDLPGHYLGNFDNFNSFDDFKNHSHYLFEGSFQILKDLMLQDFPLEDHWIGRDDMKLILGGHSLGGLLSLKALLIQQFSSFQKLGIGVGLGFGKSGKDKVHLFETDFYEKALNVRRQMVAPALGPEVVFPWIEDEKRNLKISGQTIHLIVGEDDLVIPSKGMDAFVESLKAKNNTVTMERPKTLPHHRPELGSGHIYSYLKKEVIKKLTN